MTIVCFNKSINILTLFIDITRAFPSGVRLANLVSNIKAAFVARWRSYQGVAQVVRYTKQDKHSGTGSTVTGSQRSRVQCAVREIAFYDAVFINGRRRYNFRVRSRGEGGRERPRVLISTGTPPCSPFPVRSSSPAVGVPFVKNIPQDTVIFLLIPACLTAAGRLINRIRGVPSGLMLTEQNDCRQRLIRSRTRSK